MRSCVGVADHLFGHNRLGTIELAATSLEIPLTGRAEFVEPEDMNTLELRHLFLDVARNGHVDDVDRVAVTPIGDGAGDGVLRENRIGRPGRGGVPS